jgi:hypothetical protein
MEERGYGLIESIILAFAWRYWVKALKIPVMIDILQAGIWTQY